MLILVYAVHKNQIKVQKNAIHVTMGCMLSKSDSGAIGGT